MAEFFGNTDWDEELELFVYQAEGKRGKCCPMNPETYVYRQSWGEKLAETVDPRLFICIIDSEEVAEICVPEHIAASCVSFVRIAYFPRSHRSSPTETWPSLGIKRALSSLE